MTAASRPVPHLPRLVAIALLLLISLSSASHALAQELPIGSTSAPAAATANARSISNAVGVYITKKGEAYLGQNVEVLLAAKGVKPRESYFPQFTYQAEKPLPLEGLASSSRQAGQLVRTIKSLLREWFVGLELNDPQPSMVVSNIGHKMSFKRLTLSSDREAFQRLGRASGAVFVLEAEIDHLSAGAESVLVQDARNRELVGTIGVLQPVISLSPKSRSLVLKMPFFIDVTPTGLAIEALGGQSNFAQTDLKLSYGKLLVPEIAMVINGHAYPVKTERLVRAFEDLKPQLLEQVKTLADRLVAENLAKFMNDSLATALPDKVERIAELNPPGAPEPKKGTVAAPVTPFTWVLGLTQIGLGQQVIGFTLSSSVEDPQHPEVPLDPSLAARGPVSLAGSDPTTYDLALAVNRGLINRMLQLSYARGYLSEFETKPGSKLRFFEAPVIDTDPATANQDGPAPRLRLRLAIDNPVSGFKKKLVIRDSVRFHVDVICRLVHLPKEAGMRLQLEDIDLNSLAVESSTLTSLGRGVLHAQTIDGIKDELKLASSGWAKEPALIPGELPLPPVIEDQTFLTRGLRMDKNGYLVMFLDFAKKK